MNKFEDALMDLENAANEAIKADYPFWDDPLNVTAKQALTIAAAVEKNKDELHTLVDAGDKAVFADVTVEHIMSLCSGVAEFDPKELEMARANTEYMIKAANSRHIIKDILGAIKND